MEALNRLAEKRAIRCGTEKQTGLEWNPKPQQKENRRM